MKLEQHIDNLRRHIDLVRENCCLLGDRLIEEGRTEFGVQLIARGYKHDSSKWYGIEWEYLHNGAEVPAEALALAIKHHQKTNSHHPEYHGGVNNMPELDVYEMVVDWYARSHEFGTSLRAWIQETALLRYGIHTDSQVMKWIDKAVSLLLVNHFAVKV